MQSIRGLVVRGDYPITRFVSGPDSFYPPGQFTGFSLSRYKGRSSGGSDKSAQTAESEVYDRWAQALASSADFVATACERVSPGDSHRDTFILPIVVIPNNCLWMCCYGENGRLTESPRESVNLPFYVAHQYPVVFGRLRHSLHISHLHFCTTDGLVALLKELAGLEVSDRLFPDDGFGRE